ncbi:MAG: hypothetical protein FJ135_00445 [Deltaproteobacteria bacterium]|nr:hypothetical protein [Deltaproteobacteria bacterium]
MTGPLREEIFDFSEAALQQLPPRMILEQVQKLFKKWGIYNQRLTLEHEGDIYGFICDDRAFLVYRLLSLSGASRGAPGWPVCLVTPEEVIDECSPPYPEEDYLACHLALADWLAIIGQYHGEPST